MGLSDRNNVLLMLYPHIYRTCIDFANKKNARSSVDDLVQIGMMAAIKLLDGWTRPDGKINIRSYVCAKVRWSLSDWHRKEVKKKSTSLQQEVAITPKNHVDTQDEYEHVCNLLTPEERQIFERPQLKPNKANARKMRYRKQLAKQRILSKTA